MKVIELIGGGALAFFVLGVPMLTVSDWHTARIEAVPGPALPPDPPPAPPVDDDGYDGSGIWYYKLKAIKGEAAKKKAIKEWVDKEKAAQEKDALEYKDLGFDRGHGRFRGGVEPVPGDEAPVIEVHASRYETANVEADVDNDNIVVKYQTDWRKRTQPQEDFPRFHFEPSVGDFVVSDTGNEYQITARRYSWEGKPHMSKPVLTIWLDRCRLVKE